MSSVVGISGTHLMQVLSAGAVHWTYLTLAVYVVHGFARTCILPKVNPALDPYKRLAIPLVAWLVNCLPHGVLAILALGGLYQLLLLVLQRFDLLEDTPTPPRQPAGRPPSAGVR